MVDSTRINQLKRLSVIATDRRAHAEAMQLLKVLTSNAGSDYERAKLRQAAEWLGVYSSPRKMAKYKSPELIKTFIIQDISSAISDCERSSADPGGRPDSF